MGGVLANKEGRVIGWNLVNPGGGGMGNHAMNGIAGTTDVRDEEDW